MRKANATTTRKATRSPFEIFSIWLWGYLRLNSGSLDSDRWTERIQLRMENEVCFVVEPLKLEIERLNAELTKARKTLANVRAERNKLRKQLQEVANEQPRNL